ncbi:putative E3 ubiquitin-protein ligase RHY1A [Cucumis melo var. makuwa]|uniref:E3 ubiquitin-protein ligase RHY1A n=1 Tax=Cucumis melo var. makuwa TaxID=1194695 RepID=A0A5A7U973_CUCMM|nr:putative E3 ubiquitin-protein ligase RHY1A [Cucumis melo var. makuwa]TYK03643.1 putative E3 ubiquitin-protein ligase RHY1A [Cucumis melo var. makuwa]
MAGMLPGVECARRRRCHQNKIWSDSPQVDAQVLTRRSVLCLYTSNHEALLVSNPSMQRRLLMEAGGEDELDGIAREAKRRLDERLWRTQRKSEDNGREMMRRKFSWRKLNWIGVEEDKSGQCW